MQRTIVLLAALAALAAPAAAQQAPSDDGTSANGPITIFKNMQPEDAGCRVTLNGREIDHLRTASYDDVTTQVHPGKNTLTVTWSAPLQRINFKVAYARTRNNFQNVVQVQANASTDASLRSAGSRTVTFTIPN